MTEMRRRVYVSRLRIAECVQACGAAIWRRSLCDRHGWPLSAAAPFPLWRSALWWLSYRVAALAAWVAP